MRPTRWSNCAASTWLNGCSAFYSDWDFAARLFFPARRKSLERNWRSARGLENKSLLSLFQPQLNQSRPTGFWNKATSARFLIVPANVYCDGRLLAALSARNSPTVLVDSNPPQFVATPDPKPERAGFGHAGLPSGVL